MQNTTSQISQSLKKHEPAMFILGTSQLLVYVHNGTKRQFHITTGANGFGETHNSFKTPRGWHYIRAKIGVSLPKNTYFSARRPSNTTTDISSRILWLCGIESHNHQPKQHSMLRYIYIHGTPKPFLKRPQSLGCINMRNQDISALALLIPSYCKVYIDPGE